MFRATWLQFNSILGCRHCVWIIRKSSARSNCFSFTQCWPRLWLPPTRLHQIWNAHNAFKHGCRSHRRNCLGIGTSAPPSVHKLLWSGDRRMNRVVFRRVVEGDKGESGRTEEGVSDWKSVRKTSISSGNKLDWDLLPMRQFFQPERGREALKIQSFSNMTITLER